MLRLPGPSTIGTQLRSKWWMWANPKCQKAFFSFQHIIPSNSDAMVSIYAVMTRNVPMNGQRAPTMRDIKPRHLHRYTNLGQTPTM